MHIRYSQGLHRIQALQAHPVAVPAEVPVVVPVIVLLEAVLAAVPAAAAVVEVEVAVHENRQSWFGMAA